MPFSSGAFSLYTPGNPVVTGTTIASTWANNTLTDLATGLSTCVLKDGTQTITSNLPMGGFKLTGLAAGNATGNSLRYEQLFTASTVTLLGALTVPGVLTLQNALNEAQGTTIPSVAGTTDIGAATGNYAVVSGVNTITGLGTVQAGTRRVIEFSGILILTHNGTSLILPGAANITTAAGDVAEFISEGSGNWRCVNYMRVTNGVLPVAFGMSPITNSLSGDVSLNNTGLYFDGPSIAQGTVGTWFVSGTVTVVFGTAGTGSYKLWDGTTVIASATLYVDSNATSAAVSLSGFITSPAGNLRISVKDTAGTDGTIKNNNSGNSKDSTITAIRIA